MVNASLSKLLRDMADLSELNGDNPFRIRAFRRGADAIEAHHDDLLALSQDQRPAIPGVGPGLSAIVQELSASGRVVEFEKLKKKFPLGVLDVMRVGGVGPKRAAVLFRELGIDSLAKLQAAAKKGTLATLSGFGDKLQSNISKGLESAQSGTQRLLISEALSVAAALASHLSRSPEVKNLQLAGSARRWQETVGDIDFLCTSANPLKAIAHFQKYPGIATVLGAGKTKCSVQLASGLQIDFRVVPPASFGAALLYFTGSKAHNVRLRELALKKGWTLNEYGLFRLSDKLQKRPLAGKTEEEIYAKLGMSFVPPELREDRGEIDAALKHRLPTLVEESDVLGDFHNHTKLSDGIHSLEQMTAAARERGWKWFFSADHSPSLTIAGGLPVSVLKQKIKDVRKLDKASKDMRVYVSSEVDILADGRMDYPDEVLASLDCVVASVHSRFQQPKAEMTERLCRAVRHPNVHILGHISGRKLNKRPPYDLDYEAVLIEAARHGTAVEINGQPSRQELADVHVRRAIDLGVPLALTTDAHSTTELWHMTLAVHIARRGWAEPRHLLNCLPAKEITQWLRA